MQPTLVVISLVAATFAGGANSADDDYLFYSGTVDGAIEIVAESSNSHRSSSTSSEQYAQAPRSGGITVASPDSVAVIRDSAGSFCISDSQGGLCIPDPGEPADPEDPGDPQEPTIIDVVGAAAAQIERDIARLGVRPARINHQPPGGEVLVNMDAVFYTEADVQYLSTAVLGRAVTVEVTPAWFEWDFGDGSPSLGTADLGAPYPNHTIAHVYESAGANFVTLRTTWNARFRVEGVSNWIPVSGQPVTVDQVGPISSVTKTNRLVRMD